MVGFLAGCGCGCDEFCGVFFFLVVVMVVACSELQVMGSCLQLCLVEVVEVVVAVVVVVYQYYYI